MVMGWGNKQPEDRSRGSGSGGGGGGGGGEDGGTPSPGVIGGAALVGAGVGAVLSGPLLAIGLGLGAAGLCLRKDQAGDVARSTGKAGLAVVDKGKEINERYHVTDKVKEAAQGTYQRAKEVDEEHKVVDKAKAGASRAWVRAKELFVSAEQIDREHHLTTRAGQAFGEAMDEVAVAASKKNDQPKK